MVAKSVLLLFPFILSFACWADGCQSLKALEEQWVTEELRNLKFDPSRIKQMRNNVILNKRYQELQSEMRGVLEDIMTEFMEYEEMYLELEGDEDFNNLPKTEKEYLLGPNKKKKQFINSIRKSLTNKLLQGKQLLKCFTWLLSTHSKKCPPISVATNVSGVSELLSHNHSTLH
uniref:Uncharacterized protein n=1 Tax=Biomphalaria glabrata TaxID=6526 RepID=A0A2C9LCP3_BIOGL